MRAKKLLMVPIVALVIVCSDNARVLADHTQPEIVKGSKIIGKAVQTMAGKDIGEIKDLAIDELDGQIRYAVLSFGGILGLGEKYFAIPWEALHLSDDKKHFALPVTEKELAKAPGFDKNNWPDFADPVYYATIYEFYRVPVPGERDGSEHRTKYPTTQDSNKMGRSTKENKK